MKAAGLILTFATLLACGACVAAPEAETPGVSAAPPAPPPLPVARAVGRAAPFPQAICGEQDIRNKIKAISGFNAATYGDCLVTQGSCSDMAPKSEGPPSDSTYANAIVAAFDIAPTGFKNELCGLTNIYIDLDPDSPNGQSWGMRENTATSYPTHIGLRYSVWQPDPANGYTGPYSSYETSILNTLLNNFPVGQAYAPWYPNPVFAAKPDTPTLRILAILAHEVGHIIWLRDKVGNQSCTAGPQVPFSSYTWTHRNNLHGFHSFGIVLPGDTPAGGFTLEDIRYNTNYHPNQAAALLQKVYGYKGKAPPDWASLFAFVGPDEDFVETYKLWVLTNALPDASGTGGPLNSLVLQLFNVPSRTVDVVANFKTAPTNASLYKKREWVKACYPM